MRTVLAVLLSLPLVACVEPYRYEKRGEDLVRIHKRTGATYILRKGSMGPAYWSRVLSQEEVEQQEAARRAALAAAPTPSPAATPGGTPRFFRPQH